MVRSAVVSWNPVPSHGLPLTIMFREKWPCWNHPALADIQIKHAVWFVAYINLYLPYSSNHTCMYMYIYIYTYICIYIHIIYIYICIPSCFDYYHHSIRHFHTQRNQQIHVTIDGCNTLGHVDVVQGCSGACLASWEVQQSMGFHGFHGDSWVYITCLVVQ